MGDEEGQQLKARHQMCKVATSVGHEQALCEQH